jgi:hypothetical protein
VIVNPNSEDVLVQKYAVKSVYRSGEDVPSPSVSRLISVFRRKCIFARPFLSPVELYNNHFTARLSRPEQNGNG